MDNIQDIIIELLETRGPLPAEDNLADFDFMESGHIDSIALLKFMIELERRFDIEIGPDELLSAEFRTVGGLTLLIESKMKP